MDYDNGLTSTAGNLSPMFGSNCGYSPPPCLESSLYNVGSRPNSLVNHPCYIPPQASSLPSFSPRRYAADGMSSQNVSYQPYYPSFDPFMSEADYGREETYDSLGGTEVSNKKWFRPQINFQRNVKMHSEMGKERFNEPTSVKRNPRRKKYSRNKNNIPKETFPSQNIYNNPQRNYYNPYIVPNHTQRSFTLGNFSAQDIENNSHSNYYDPNIAANHTQSNSTLGKISAQDIDNNPQTNYDSNAVLNKVPNEVMSKRNFPTQSIAYNPQTSYDPSYVLNNVQNDFTPRENFPSQSIYNNPQTNCDPNMLLNQVPSDEVSASNKEANECSSMGNEQNHAFGKNDSHLKVTEASIDLTSTTVMNSVVTEETSLITSTDKDTNFNTQPHNDLLLRIFAGTVLSDTDVSDKQALDNIDLADYQLTHVTMPENSVFNIQDVRQENVENADITNYSFEPIYEGKDDNGDDMVVLRVLPNSNAQHGNEDEDRTDALANDQISEMQNRPVALKNASDFPEASNETLFKRQAQEMNNVTGENIFFPHIHDNASKETVTASKLIRTKKGKKSNNSRVQNNAATASYISQPSTSSNSGNIYTSSSHHASSSYGRRKFGKQWMSPSWRRRHQWKYNDLLKSIQRIFFRRFLRKVRMENEHMMVSENFWNSYRMLVTQIGSSVMQAMYNILPALIRNSGPSVERSNGAASRATKNSLKVKFPPKLKKQYNSGN